MKKLFLAASLSLITSLQADVKVLALSGSTREDSFNKKLIQLAVETAKSQGDTVTLIDLRDYPMPLFDEDIEKSSGMPESAKKLRQLMKNSDAIIIATPEYNGSISAVLKNAIDWATRNERGEPTRDAFQGKKFILLSASLGGGGGSTSLAHLKSIVERVGGNVISAQISVGNAGQAFDANGKLKDQALNKKLQNEIGKLNAQSGRP